MPWLTPLVTAAINDATTRFGALTILPIALLAFGVWATARTATGYVRTLKAMIAERDAEIRSLQEARLKDAVTQLEEMRRVTRETEQARAARRELDERFLPIQRGMLQLLGRDGAEPAEIPRCD